jgi:Tfp pilus assembly protein PilN
MSRATLRPMRLHRTRFAVVLIGDRLSAALVQGREVQTFVVESEQPAAALRAELDARKVSPRTVAIGLPRTAVTVKPIELPTVGADTREMVRFELERHVPFPSEDAAFDYVPFPAGEMREQPADAGRRVLLVAADRRVVDTALRIIQEVKVRARSVTVAAHNLLALARPPARGRVVWIHRSYDTLDMLFIGHGQILLSRALPVVDDTVLATEIRRSFSLVRWRGCDVIWVSGDAAAPAALIDTALGTLGAPVTAPNYTLAARRALGAIDAGPRGALELAVGMALAPVDPPLDLLPAAQRPFRLTRSHIVTGAIAAATVVLALSALMVPGYRDGRRLARLDADIARLDPEVRTVERMLKDLEGKRRVVGTVENLEATALRPLAVMREITELLPNDAWLTLLSLDTKGAELTGQANAASALIPLLENSARFERVEFASPVTRGRDREQFRIQAAWEATTAAAAPARTTAATPPTSPRRQPGALGPPGATAPPPAAGAAAPPTAAVPSPAPPAAAVPTPALTPPPAAAPAPQVVPERPATGETPAPLPGRRPPQERR